MDNNKNSSFNIDNSISKKEKILKYASPLKAIIYFSLPTIVIMLVSSLYNLADKIMAQLFAAPNLLNDPQIMNWYHNIIGDQTPSYGQMIIDMKGYINIATQYSYVVFNIGAAFASLIAIGSSILYSIEYGKRNYKNMKIIFNNAIIFSIIITIISSIVLFFLTSPTFGSQLIVIQEGNHYNPIVTKLAWNYISIFLLLMPLFALNFVFMTTLRSQGKTISLVLLNIVSLLLNSFLDFIIIKYGHLNLNGAMMATGVSWVFNIIIIIFIMYFEKDQNLKFEFKYFKIIDKKLFKDSSLLGLTPFFIKTSNAVMSIMTAFFITHLNGNSLVDEKGTFVLQQMTASMMPWFLVLLNVSIGISQGVRIIMSYAYGAKDKERIKKLTYNIMVILFVWMLIFDIAILAFGPYMAMTFAFPREYAFQYRWYIFALNYSYPFFAFTFTMITLLNSIKRPISSAFISLLRSAIMFIILSVIGFELSNYIYNNVSTNNAGLSYIIFIGSNDLMTLLVLIPWIIGFAKKNKIEFQKDKIIKTKKENEINKIQEDTTLCIDDFSDFSEISDNE